MTSYGTSALGLVSYTWKFGDGNVRKTRDLMILHTYLYSGAYTVRLAVTTPSQNLTTNYQLFVYESKKSNLI